MARQPGPAGRERVAGVASLMRHSPQVPSGWQILRLGDVAEVNPRRPKLDLADDTQVTFLPMTAVADDFLGILTRDQRLYREVAKGYTYFEENDVLFSKITPCLQNGKHTLATELNGGFGFGTTEFHVVRAGKRATAKYLFRVLTQPHLIEQCRKSFTGTAGQQRVQPETLKALRIALPPPPEQRAIAAVLDSIDEAIERTEAVIAATERLRDALLHELLTRGVPGWHTEWKDVPGIGTIPASWEVVRLGEVYEVQLGKMLSPKARQGKNPRPYLTNRNVRWGGFDLSDLPTMDFDHREIEKFHLRPGDLLVCEGGDTGRAAVWLGEIADCYYQKALHRLRPTSENAISGFMLAVLMSYAKKGILLEHSERTSISHLTRERLLRMRIGNPPRSEQEHIVAVLRSVATRTREAHAEREALAELKASVAAVLLTGQVRVPVDRVWGYG